MSKASSSLSSETCDFIENIRVKYGIQGTAIGLVTGPEASTIETKTFGVADVKGNKVTDEVERVSYRFKPIAERISIVHLRNRIKLETLRCSIGRDTHRTRYSSD